jgi:signal transduction histidine kinase
VLAPVYVVGGASVGFLGVGFAVSLASSIVGNVFWAIALACFIALPFSFVGGLLRWRVSRAGVRMLLDSGGETGSRDAEGSLRLALGDPSLRLAYWLEEERCYVDCQGELLEPGSEGEGRLTTEISYEERPLAAIEYDASLSHEPELLEEVVATARLTLEKDRDVERLRRSEARGRALLSVLPDAMIRTNREGVYLEVQGNRGGLVRPAEELIGLSIRETLSPDLVERVLACVDRTLATGKLQTLEYDLDLRGERRSFEARMIPSGADEVVSVVRDFSNERRLREELTVRLSELRASRARIVEAGDAERRRLERNLHDGAQQHLVSLSIALRLAQARIATDPVAATEILDGASDELASALEELRELARGLHPAVLSDRGLEAALDGLAQRAPLPVEIETELDRRLPPAVEAAAYYLVAESLTNIVKHSNATQAHVRVICDDGLATVEVCDDGRGGADAEAGSGLRGLADRLAALDGQFAIASPLGKGTAVRAILPVPPSEDESPGRATDVTAGHGAPAALS